MDPTYECLFRLELCLADDHPPPAKRPAEPDACPAVANKIRAMFNEEEFSDVRLVCGGTTFHCHKMVLVSQSPVFRAMFRHAETRESQEGEVKVEGADPVAMEALLEAMYGKPLDRRYEYGTES